uniref:Uncharacterized protein n=1 Tax=Oryzias sinensis TaxID=183150 RepID=A0A8C7Y9I1_9TELE
MTVFGLVSIERVLKGLGFECLWTEEDTCTVVNATIVWDVNCSYSCGAECWKSSRYPCLQVFVSLNSTEKVVRLLHNED